MISGDLNSHITILLAENEGPLKQFVSALLNRQGYNLIIVSTAPEALERAQAFRGVIDLLLTDIDIAGMTGIELAIQVNRARPDTKILMISGLDSGILLLNNGWQFLPTPFLADMLRDRIRDFLSEQPPLTTAN